ncbi:DeoR-family transcriptional regulator [Candidatus Vecturithrix granuli]|uniref:DeoR-family transcriptional regulator n=1 Tax=Vecturithrix granuli TaxID=1499967 RepID=A0A081C0E7_VECG1|nr:DeoR-family transcriptional regulator [Candidatus Vecturithrix granuli]
MERSGKNMNRIERHANILQLVKERGFIGNDELAKLLHVSIVTIRRDLKALRHQRLITLEHGGVAAADYIDGIVEPLYETKAYIHSEQKQAIGIAAAKLVEEGDTIILDSGTTTACIARHLKNSKLNNVTVITNDLMIGKELCPHPGINVLVVGGILRKSFYTAYGLFTEQFLKQLKAHKAFLGLDAASITRGISALQPEEIAVKQGMMAISDEVILTSDSSKFGLDATYKICDWNVIDRVVTDSAIGKDFRDFFSSANIQLNIVDILESSAKKSNRSSDSANKGGQA